MVNTNVTQRDFATLAGISTTTVVAMLKDGRLQRGSDGKIPPSQIKDILLNRLRSQFKIGDLLITLNADKDEQAKAILALLAAEIKEGNNSLIAIQDKEALYQYITEFKAPEETNNFVHKTLYNKKILHNFINSYIKVMENTFFEFLKDDSFRELCSLPANVLHDFIFYDQLPEEYNGVACITSVRDRLDSLFSDLMIANGLVKSSETNELLFSRKDISASFLDKKNSNLLYNNIITNNIKPIVVANTASKSQIYVEENRNIDAGLSSLVDNGYYTLLNCKEHEDYYKLAEILSSRLYNKLVIYADSVEEIRSFSKELADVCEFAEQFIELCIIPRKKVD